MTPELLDLQLLPLVRRDGQEVTTLPGLHIAAPPRRIARGRQPDHLVLHLELQGNAPLDRKQQDQLMQRLAEQFYKTPGAVTSALRAAVDDLNQYLLERNLRAASSGQQSLGLLTLLVLREGRLYLAQSGPTHIFIVSPNDTQHLYDTQIAGRGLGMGKTASLRFSQAELAPGDILVIASQPPAAWVHADLSETLRQGPEGLRRLLVNTAGLQLSAWLALAQKGSGKIQLLRPKSGPAIEVPIVQPAPPPIEQPAVVAPAPTPKVFPQNEPEWLAPEAPGYTPVQTRPIIEDEGEFEALEEELLAGEKPEAQVAAVAPAPAQQESPARERRGRKERTTGEAAPLGRAASAAGASLTGGARRMAGGMGTLLQRMLPEQHIGTLPASVMFFIALAVPAIIVTIASVVYIQRGQAAQYQSYYSQAADQAAQAVEASDPIARRTAWQNVISLLDSAEGYKKTDESVALRQQAQAGFDEMDAIRRLEFQPALASALPENFQTTQLAATDSDLYMLNGIVGNVWRALLTGQGYDFDNTFQCGPNYPGSQSIGPLVDIVPLPKGHASGATLLAMDGSGNFLLCAPGAQSQFIAAAPPSTGWGKPVAMSLDLDTLYVLDPTANAVWIYWDTNLDIAPELFFAQEVPPMQTAQDLAVDKNDLYLLHNDGHITLCTYSSLEVSPTRCTDPVPYTDSRPGKAGQILLPGSPFLQILATQPPDPSLYFLLPQEQAIYHFSLRQLTFQRQLRPQPSLLAPTTTATAFTLSPDGRIAFMAFGNRVYYAAMP